MSHIRESILGGGTKMLAGAIAMSIRLTNAYIATHFLKVFEDP